MIKVFVHARDLNDPLDDFGYIGIRWSVGTELERGSFIKTNAQEFQFEIVYEECARILDRRRLKGYEKELIDAVEAALKKEETK